jgi:hypothetical protein
MFDTIAEHRIERAALSSPCKGLGGCNEARARAQQAEAHFVEVRDRLNELIKERDNYNNGTQQQEYVLLEQKQQKVRDDNNKMDAEIARLKVIVDAWENNPQQQAGVEGLAWGWWDRNIKATWNKAFSCDTYTDREKDWIEKVRPYEQWVSGVSADINNAKQRLSPENLQQQRNTLAELEKLNAQKKELIANYNKRINDARTSYQANKDAQKLALEREAQEAAAKEQAKATAKEQAKQTQTIILVGAALVGGYLLFHRSATKVNA